MNLLKLVNWTILIIVICIQFNDIKNMVLNKHMVKKYITKWYNFNRKSFVKII